MGLFSRKKTGEPSLSEVKRQLEALLEKEQLFLETLRALFVVIKGFSFDIDEIGADRFKARIDSLMKLLEQEDPSRKLRRALEEDKASMMEFIARKSAYFEEREKEFKKIIELLMDGLKQMTGDTQDFTKKVYEANIKIEQVTHLDDIRKIRESIKSEVTEMKKVISEKQVKDRSRMESLSQEVTVLRTDLEKAEKASMTDALTGAENRMSFDLSFTQLVERSMVNYAPFALLMCDLDNFKAVNDTFGHGVGDRVLKAFVHECRGVFRKDDIIARYGGEEFAVILPAAPLKIAFKRAQSLCKIVAAKQYLIDPDHPDRMLSFTVSVGVTVLQKKDTAETMLERADKALYKAKSGGKNRAVSL